MGFNKAISGVKIQLTDAEFILNVWEPGDDPVIGPLLSIDTETELFVDHEFPDLVMMQVTAGHRIDLVHWEHKEEYINQLLRYNTRSTIVFVNAAYDLGVLKMKCLYDLVDQRRIVDMQDRYKLWEIAERGFVRAPASLKNMTKNFLMYNLPKDDDLRLNFTRKREPSLDQLRYGAYDVAATWLLGKRMPAQPTEADSQIMGSIVLDAIARKGMRVDIERFWQLHAKFTDRLWSQLFDLEFNGYCPLLSKSSREILEDGLKALGVEVELSGITGPKMEYILLKALVHQLAPVEHFKNALLTAIYDVGREDTPLLGLYEVCEETVNRIESEFDYKLKRDRVEAAWNHLKQHMSLDDIIAEGGNTRCNPFKGKLRKRITEYVKMHVGSAFTLDTGKMVYHSNGLGLDRMAGEESLNIHAMSFLIRDICIAKAGKNPMVPEYSKEAMASYLNAKVSMYGHYTSELRDVYRGDAFMQARLTALEALNPGLVFPRTEEGKIQLSLKDKWLLVVHNVQDKVLETYIDYKHNEKLLSTYLNPDHIGKDGRIHTRFENYLKTGRTSSSKPNIQNVPGSDGIRGMYIPSDGHLLASIDYSQLELCSLAEHCIRVFGFSRLGELINAKIDVHSWFAGYTTGIVTEDNDYKGTPETRELVVKLLEDVAKKDRKNAKAANFGFPGGMKEKTFLKTQRGYGNIEITMDDCTVLRDNWFKAFPEMALYMNPEGDTLSDKEREKLGTDARFFKATNVAGVTRRRCTFNSACNFPFQSLAAVGAKRALWKVWRDPRYSDKIVNFIHDELLLELPVETAAQDVANVAALMEEAMREVITHVRIEAEGCLMERWDKEAEAVYDDFGNLTVWRPVEAA